MIAPQIFALSDRLELLKSELEKIESRERKFYYKILVFFFPQFSVSIKKELLKTEIEAKDDYLKLIATETKRYFNK